MTTMFLSPRAPLLVVWSAVVLLAVFFLAPHVITLDPGLFYFPDTERYRVAAQMLLDNGFQYRPVFAAFETSYVALPFTAGYITLVALFIKLLGTKYGLAIFIIGIVLLAVGMGLLAAELGRRTGQYWAPWLFPLILALSPNITYHIKPVQTDAIFTGLYLLALWLALRYSATRRGGDLIWLLVVSVVAVFVRASGPAALAVAFGVIALTAVPDRWWSGARFLGILAALIGAMLAGVLTFGLVSLYSDLFPIKPDGYLMQITPDDIGRFLSQSDYQLPNPDGPWSYMRVFAARVDVFFDLITPYYSFRHNLFRVATYGVMYLGCIAGCVAIVFGRGRPEEGRAFAIGLLYVLAIPFFHGAVYMLDNKNRFFMYVEGILLWFGILGFVLAWQLVQARRTISATAAR